jgi:hypothetical protein
VELLELGVFGGKNLEWSCFIGSGAAWSSPKHTLRDALILPNQKVVGYRSTSNHNFKRRLSTVTCIVPPVPPFTV